MLGPVTNNIMDFDFKSLIIVSFGINDLYALSETQGCLIPLSFKYPLFLNRPLFSLNLGLHMFSYLLDAIASDARQSSSDKTLIADLQRIRFS
jgi:predicted signal transduction protein with EAL and GGDEF domain